jgi:predicted KAP-like P-loop ATPase
MPSKKESEPLVSRVQSLFQQLSAAAATLNTASDRLSKLVAELDAALKTLNVGLVCWVDIRPARTSEDGLETWSEQVGYAKISGKWGIALRTVHENLNWPLDDHVEEWAFSEAPRQLRLKAVDLIPALLDNLAKTAADNTKKITEKTDEAQQLLTAIKGGASR